MNFDLILSKYLSALTVELLAGRLFKSDSWTTNMHMLGCNKIYYVLDGSFQLTMNGRTVEIKKNQLVIVPEGTYHSYQLTSNSIKLYWCHFNSAVNGVNIFETYKIEDSGFFFDIKDIGGTEKLFKEMLLDETEKSGAALVMYKHAKLMELLSICIENSMQKDREESFEKEEFSDIIKYMYAHIDENLQVEHLAEMAHFHPNYFIRAFKQKFGASPIRFFNQLKLERAKELLQNTDKPMSAIALEIGINDMSYFSRFVKQQTGLSPSEYRNIYKGL